MLTTPIVAVMLACVLFILGYEIGMERGKKEMREEFIRGLIQQTKNNN